MIPPWSSIYGHGCTPDCTPDCKRELPYHLRPVDLLRADEPWIGALYLDGPAPAAAGRPSARDNSGDGAAAGATIDSHQEGRSGLGVRTPAAAAVSGERPQLEERGPVPPTSQVRGGSRSSRSDRLPPVSTDRPPGPSATTTTGRPGGHHVAGGRVEGPVSSATSDGGGRDLRCVREAVITMPELGSTWD